VIGQLLSFVYFSGWAAARAVSLPQRHLSKIDRLTAHTTSLVCFISTVNSCSKKEEKKPIETGASSGHITNLKQSILETFDIYVFTLGEIMFCLHQE
jgi:hypothetical protein